jgi:hypothetical protein
MLNKKRTDLLDHSRFFAAILMLGFHFLFVVIRTGIKNS